MNEEKIVKGDSDYVTGDAPPEGMYVCIGCDSTDAYIAFVPEVHQKLPVCPKCGGRHWMKI